MRLANEQPSAMVQQAVSLLYDDYQLELWQHLMAGVVIGAGLALIVALAFAHIAQVQA